MNPVQRTCILMAITSMCLTGSEGAWKHVDIVIEMREELKGYVTTKVTELKGKNDDFNDRLEALKDRLEEFLGKDLGKRETLKEFIVEQIEQQTRLIADVEDLLEQQKETMTKSIKSETNRRAEIKTYVDQQTNEQKEKIADFKETLQQHKTTMDEKIKKGTDDAETLELHVKEKVSEIGESIDDLTTRLDTLEKTMKEFLDRDSKVVFFKAVYANDESQPRVDQALPYSLLESNDGGGYDGRVFTAPVSGYYTFHISMETAVNSFINVELRTDEGETIITKLRAGDAETQDYSHASGVISLEAGQSVTPVTTSVSGGFSVNPEGISEFYGFLL